MSLILATEAPTASCKTFAIRRVIFRHSYSELSLLAETIDEPPALRCVSAIVLVRDTFSCSPICVAT